MAVGLFGVPGWVVDLDPANRRELLERGNDLDGDGQRAAVAVAPSGELDPSYPVADRELVEARGFGGDERQPGRDFAGGRAGEQPLQGAARVGERGQVDRFLACTPTP